MSDIISSVSVKSELADPILPHHQPVELGVHVAFKSIFIAPVASSSLTPINSIDASPSLMVKFISWSFNKSVATFPLSNKSVAALAFNVTDNNGYFVCIPPIPQEEPDCNTSCNPFITIV